jgi:hypothetical protein
MKLIFPESFQFPNGRRATFSYPFIDSLGSYTMGNPYLWIQLEPTLEDSHHISWVREMFE